jgi:hypothetical protein
MPLMALDNQKVFRHTIEPYSTGVSERHGSPCAGYLSDPPGVMGFETTTLKFPIGQRYSSRLSMFQLDVEEIPFRRVQCSSGAEPSPNHRNYGQLGQANLPA